MAAMVVANGRSADEIGMNPAPAMAPLITPTQPSARYACSQNLQAVFRRQLHGPQGNNYAQQRDFAENEERSRGRFQCSMVLSERQHGEYFTGAAHGFTLGVREQYWREHVRSMLRGWTTARRPLSSIPSPRGSSSTAADSTPRRNSSSGFTKTP
jgi:hypothetical protein